MPRRNSTIFLKTTMKLGVIEEKSPESVEKEEKKCLAFEMVRIHGKEAFALMDSGATANVLSTQLVRKLLKDPTESRSL